MARQPKKTDTLDAEKIISEIAEGSTQLEIADRSGVSVGALNGWLHADPERSARARAAMKTSAEAWLDRGLQALKEALPDSAEIARARAIEQHCARRAAIRDPARYGERTTLAGDPEAPLLPNMTDEQLAAKVAALQAKLAGKGGAA